MADAGSARKSGESRPRNDQHVDTLNQTHTMAQAAQQMASEAQNGAIRHHGENSQPPVSGLQPNMEFARHDENVEMTTPVTTQAVPANMVSTTPRLRKMDVNPPIFDGLIDGIKLNSFIFQFESYFKQNGYNIAQHDHLLIDELNQCVRKKALTWHQRYMMDTSTVKLWSAVKSDMMREFRAPNFDDKIRNQLLTIRQTRGYHGYVSKFRELQRVVRLDELTAVNLFVNVLSNAEMKKAIQRKQPASLTAAVDAGFLELEVLDKSNAATPLQNRIVSERKARAGNTKQARGGVTPKANRNSTGPRSQSNKPASSLCPHCQKGVHDVDDCWVLHPEKKPPNLQQKQKLQQIHAMLEALMVGYEQTKLLDEANVALRAVNIDDPKNLKTKEKDPVRREYFCLLHVNSTVNWSSKDIGILNSNFVDSGATMDGVSPSFCTENGLWDQVVDHHEPMEITLAAKEKMTIPAKTIKLTLYMDDVKPYVNEFLVFDVPEEQDILLEMPWLKINNPHIDWVEERKPKDIEYIFAIRSMTEKESGEEKQEVVDIASYRNHPAFPVLLAHEAMFQQKLPSSLPPRKHGEHEIEVIQTKP
ncbi:unnamed protein product [Phytophthora fragariaefolia]|uniref:Unnamed protein product n=1 Tax=Phytophthora fragariaefolia TaxID=1490495 RepID=A0A9W6XTH3_9STRA|nr:unnamed protein product [Phytophthora fragariaefolia]